MSHAERGDARRRTEDAALIRGRGEYLDDIALDCPVHLAFARSPVAAGRLRGIDLDAALALPGVLAAYTATDLASAGIHDLPAGDVAASSRHPGRKGIGQPALARGVVRYVGEPVVAVVAETARAAEAGARAVVVDVDPAPAVADPASAASPDAPRVHDSVEGNLLGILEHGDAAATDAAFQRAARVVVLDLENNRLAPCAIEPRGAAAVYDADSDEMTLYQGCQGVHGLKQRICDAVPIDAERLRVVCPDVGGGFGLKAYLQCETVSVLHAARALGRPAKWVARRRESFLADLHGRDHRTRAELALDEDGRFLAVRVAIDSNVGAYQSQSGALIAWIGAYMTTGCYRFEAAYASVRLLLTNTVPVDAYRGAGRPEAAYLIERLVDKAAREIGLAPDEIRRRNFIPADAFPYRVATGVVYDSGRYEALMDTAMQRADWAGFAARREASAERGRRRGIGLAYYVEICAGYGDETVEIAFTPDRRLTARVGTQSTGQGHETAFAQLVERELGVPMHAVRVLQGDTRLIKSGYGTGGSRSLAIAGSALVRACAALLEQASQQAAAMLGVDRDRLQFADGEFRADDTALALADVASASFDDGQRAEGVAPGLAVSGAFEPRGGTFPNGCHICEVEVDPETGQVEVLRYTVQDDFGHVVNPLLLEGQVVGGIAQGLGQALLEHARYAPDDGRLLSDTLMGYALPYAEDMPNVDFDVTPVATPRNPLGVKGAGEAGTIGAPPALVNAVVDALHDDGIVHLDMPLTASRVWHALSGLARRERRHAA